MENTSSETSTSSIISTTDDLKSYYNACVQHMSHRTVSPSNSQSQRYDEVLLAYDEYKLSASFYQWFLPLLVILGTTGNVLSLLVSRRHSKLHHKSVGLYITFLSIGDTAVLWVSAFRYWIGRIVGVDIKMLNDPFCAIIGGFFYHFCRHFAVWTVVALTFERFLIVMFPTKVFATRSRYKQAKVVMLVLALTIGAVDFHTLFTYRVIEDCVFGNDDVLQHRCYIVGTPRRVWPWIDFSIYAFIPVSMLTFMNIAIMVGLFHAERRRKRLNYAAVRLQRTNSNLSGSSERSNYGSPIKKGYFTVMPLVISTAFITLTTPITILEIIYSDVRSVDPHSVAVIRLVRTVCFMLMYTNHSVNFLLYVVSGKIFRQSLMELCTCRRDSLTHENSQRDLAKT